MPRVILKPPAEHSHDPQRIPPSMSITLSRSTGGEKPDSVPKPMNRAASMKYKEKFNAMRHKYEQVTAKQNEYLRQLDTANAKMKKLQAENDLLLDVISTGGQWTPPPPLNDPTKPPYQVQQYPHHPSQPPLTTAPLHHLSPYPAPSYSYTRSHEGYPPPPTPTVMQGLSNQNYPPLPGQLLPAPVPTPPHHNHHSHNSHNRRSPHLIHVNGEKASGTNVTVNDYPTHTRTMESNERELPASNPQILLPPSRSTQPHHHHSQQGPPPPSPPLSSHESNGRHQ